MLHTVLLSDVIDLITLDDGSQYELHEYADACGISQDDLINSASRIDRHTVYAEDTYTYQDLAEDFTDAFFNFDGINLNEQ